MMKNYNYPVYVHLNDKNPWRGSVKVNNILIDQLSKVKILNEQMLQKLLPIFKYLTIEETEIVERQKQEYETMSKIALETRIEVELAEKELKLEKEKIKVSEPEIVEKIEIVETPSVDLIETKVEPIEVIESNENNVESDVTISIKKPKSKKYKSKTKVKNIEKEVTNDDRHETDCEEIRDESSGL